MGGRLRFSLVLLLALAPACVSIEKQCREGNWYGIGVDNGERGWSRDFADAYLKSCPPLGVTPDENALQEGWEEGNSRYCEPESIGSLARTGSVTSFPAVCAWCREETWPFYVYGRCIYLDAQIPSNEKALSNLRRQFEDARGKGKKAHLSMLIVGLRGVLRGMESEYIQLRCGR
jgi:hypothetical protein